VFLDKKKKDKKKKTPVKRLGEKNNLGGKATLEGSY